jgi:hypothetical protein
MTSSATNSPAAADRQWFIVGRWGEFEGEGRTNLLRAVGLAAFYAVELVNYHGLNLGFVQMPSVVDRTFHLAMTLLTVAWAMLCLCVFACRRHGIFPGWLKFISAGCDLLLLTTVLNLAEGPRSPLVVVYFLIIATAGLRFSLPLIWFATAGAVAGYLFLAGFARWGEVPGWPRADVTVPRHYVVIVVIALVLAGVVVGQIVRRVRGMAEEFAQRQAAGKGGPP